jgi:preprotein translocase subunit YajC
MENEVTPGCAGGGLDMLLPFIMMIGVFYLFIIRPQQKKAKDHRMLLDNLKVNDKVVTSSGIFGKVTVINDSENLVTIRVDENTNTKITFQKSHITQVLSKEEGDA